MIIKKAWMKLTSEEIKANKEKYKDSKYEPKDTIITELKEVVEIEKDENGYTKKTIKYEPVKTNLTKKINATAQKLKIENNLKILDKIGEINNG